MIYHRQSQSVVFFFITWAISSASFSPAAARALAPLSDCWGPEPPPLPVCRGMCVCVFWGGGIRYVFCFVLFWGFGGGHVLSR